ncbi:MAG: 3-deoxy-7-phosphoheptulonate synthase [Planctomycetes bacterium]|nr:3-deoxy-7-phosphoheptulonate synthase [Planctomycetota bacterium]
MIVVMKEGATVAEIGQVIREIETSGLQARPSHGARQTVIGIMGAPTDSCLAKIEALPCVSQVTPFNQAFKLVSRGFKPDPTVVKVNGTSIGDKAFVVMAGPCSVESSDQLFTAARAVAAAGAEVLRGGAFKPRTSPYSFQGLGEDGLKILLAAKRETGLVTVTEAISPEVVSLVARYADIIQIGARNMQNYALLEAVGKARKPVLLKRGLMSTIEELLLAAEYILSNGNNQVMLCERGIRTFEKATRNTLDLSAVPVIKAASHLPVIVDPSHAIGVRKFIPAMARASVAAGADGIIVEVHPAPEKALSDGAQSLHLNEFTEMMDSIRPIAAAVGRTMKAPPGEGFPLQN